jgi:hypothetical protein
MAAVAGIGLAVGTLAGTFSLAHAQDPKPRWYSNAPGGLDFRVFGYGFKRGGRWRVGSVPNCSRAGCSAAP